MDGRIEGGMKRYLTLCAFSLLFFLLFLLLLFLHILPLVPFWLLPFSCLPSVYDPSRLTLTPYLPFQLIRNPRSRSQQLLNGHSFFLSQPSSESHSPYIHSFAFPSLPNFVLLPHLLLPSLFNQVSKRSKSSRHHDPLQQQPTQQQPGRFCRC